MVNLSFGVILMWRMTDSKVLDSMIDVNPALCISVIRVDGAVSATLYLSRRR